MNLIAVRKTSHALVAALSLVLLFGLGCTRKNDATSTIRINFGSSAEKSSAQSADNIFYVSFNISGPNVKNGPIVKTWELERDGTNRPTEYSETLSKGTTLFQYLAVGRDQTTGALFFYYGDAEKDLQAANETVEIRLTAITGSGSEGRVAGRFMDAQNRTGRVAMKFNPPSGKKSMTVLYEHIFGGWVDKFTIIDHPSVSFDYVLVDANGVESATPIIEKLSPSSPLLAASPNVVRFKFPLSYRYFSGNDDDIDLMPPEVLYYGYFGSGGAGKIACYGGHDTNIPDLYTTPNSGSHLIWFHPPTAANHAGRISGGTLNGSCAGPAYEKVLTYDHLKAGSGDDIGFKGPYAKHADADHYNLMRTSWNESTGVLTVDWSYLPGTGGTNGLTGTAVYFSANASDVNYESVLEDDDPNFTCQSLTSKGFTEYRVPYSTQSKSFSGITREILEKSKIKIALCPYRGTEVFTSGIETYGLWHLTAPRPRLSLIGSSPDESQYTQTNNFLDTPGLKLRKSDIINGYHKLVGLYGNQFISSTSVQSLHVTADGGTTWTQLGTSYPGMFVSGFDAAGVTLSGGFTSLLGNISIDSTVQFKMTLSDPALFGLNDPIVLSEPIVLRGAELCGSATLKAKNLSLNVHYTNATFLGDIYNVADATDLKYSYSLVYDGGGCDAQAVVDTIAATMETCLEYGTDIVREPSKPFTFTVDPKDTRGMNCTAADGTKVAVSVPSYAGTPVKIEREVSGMTLIHSITTKSLLPLLTATDLASVGLDFLQIKKWVSGAGGVLKGKFFRANQDIKLTNGTSVTSVDWTVQKNHFASPGAGAAPFFSLTANSVAAASAGPYRQRASITGTTNYVGEFESVIHSVTNPVVYISQAVMQGGNSPLFVTKGSGSHSGHIQKYDGGVYSFVIPNSANGPIEARPMYGSLPGDYGLLATLSDDKIQFGVVSNLYYAPSVYWSGAVTLPAGAKPLGFVQDGSYLNVFAANSTLEQAEVYQIIIPTFDTVSNSWGSVTHPSSASNSSSNIHALGVAMCGMDFVVYGTHASDPSKMKFDFYSMSGTSQGSVTTLTGQASASYNRAECIRSNDQNNIAYFQIMLYSDTQASSTVPVKFFAVNKDTSPVCNDELPAESTMLLTTPNEFNTSSGAVRIGKRHLPGLNNAKFAVSVPGTHTSIYQIFEEGCPAGNTPNLSSPTLIGSVPGANSIHGLSSARSMTPVDSLWVHGANGMAIETQ